MTKDLVSILVPVYNSEKYLSDCFLSLKNQTYKNLEVIFVDDGSTDNSLNLIKQFCNQNSFAKFVAQPNGGVSNARNNALKNASGEFIFFLDSDDIIAHQTIELFVKEIKQQQSDLVCGKCKTFKENFSFNKDKTFKSYKLKNIDNNLDDIYSFFISKQIRWTYKAIWNKLFRASIINKVLNYPNVFPEHIAVGEDTFFLVNYLMNCKKISFINHCTFFYRIRKDSLCHKDVEYSYLTVFKSIEALKDLDKTTFKKTNFYYHKHNFINACQLFYKVYKSTAEKDKQQIFDELKKQYIAHRKELKYCPLQPKMFSVIFMSIIAKIYWHKLSKKLS